MEKLVLAEKIRSQVEKILNQSKTFEKSLKFDEAKNEIEAALLLNPKSIEALLQKAHLEYLMGNFGECFQTCITSFGLSPLNESLKWQFKEYEKAIRRVLFLNPAIRLRSLDPAALEKLFRKNRFVKRKAPRGTEESRRWVDVVGYQCFDEDVLKKIADCDELEKALDIGGFSLLPDLVEAKPRVKPLRKRKTAKPSVRLYSMYYLKKNRTASTIPRDSFAVSDRVKGLFMSMLNFFHEAKYAECLREARELLEALRCVPEDLLPRKIKYRLNAYDIIGRVHRKTLRFDKAVEWHKKEVRLVEKHRMAGRKIKALSNLASDYMLMGDFVLAYTLLDSLLYLVVKGSDRADVLHAISRCQLELGDLCSAEMSADMSLRCSPAVGGHKWKFKAYIQLARIAVAAKRYGAAIENFLEAKTLVMRIGDVALQQRLEEAIGQVRDKAHVAAAPQSESGDQFKCKESDVYRKNQTQFLFDESD